MKCKCRFFECKPYKEVGRKEIILILIPVILFVFYAFKLVPCIFASDLDPYIFIILYSFTIAFKFINPYISLVDNKISSTLEATICVIMLKLPFLIIGFFLIWDNDPQNLFNRTNSLTHFIKIDLVRYTLVGIGEVVLCLFVLMVFLCVVSNKIKYRLAFCIILTSFVFAILHGTTWSIKSIIPIFIAHIPYIYSYNKFGSLIPAVVAHYVYDALNVLALIPGFRPLAIFIFEIIILLFFMRQYKISKLLCS